MYISHSSKIPGQPRDEQQWEEEEEEEEESGYLAGTGAPRGHASTAQADH